MVERLRDLEWVVDVFVFFMIVYINDGKKLINKSF